METVLFQELHLEAIYECSFRTKFPLPILTFLLRKRYPKIYRALSSSAYTASSPLRAKLTTFGDPEEASSTLIITTTTITIIFCRLTEGRESVAKEMKD